MTTDNRAAAAVVLQEAWANLSLGRKDDARRLARRAASLDPGSEGPWLVLAALGSPEESLEYLHKALEINPSDRRAIDGLQWARGRIKAKREASTPEPSTSSPASSPDDLSTRSSRKPEVESGPGIEPALMQELERELIAKGYSSPFLDQTRPVTVKLPEIPPAPPRPSSGPAIKPEGTRPPVVQKTTPKKAPQKPLPPASRAKIAAFMAGGLVLCLFLSAAVMIPFSNLFFPSLVSAKSSTAGQETRAVFSGTNSRQTIAPPLGYQPAEETEPSEAGSFSPSPMPSITYAPTFTPVWTQTPVFTSTPPPTVEAIPVEPRQSEIQTANTEFSGRWIDVDLANQMAYAYEDDEIIREFVISSGIAAYPTVTGQYHIYLKYRFDDMVGPGYNLKDVPYVMYFYKGYGLHGTYWHDNFGTPMSHGCVNMRTEDAEWLYDFAPMGTLVNVH